VENDKENPEVWTLGKIEQAVLFVILPLTLASIAIWAYAAFGTQ
jgi:hypothetical protein